MEDPFLRAALREAEEGLAEGGIPIGSVLVLDGEIVGRGHNRRVQRGSPILHAETYWQTAFFLPGSYHVVLSPSTAQIMIRSPSS